jgi:hypothetical protein
MPSQIQAAPTSRRAAKATVSLRDRSLAAVLRDAERFISGFEDDEMQEGIPALLVRIRAAIAELKP